MTARNGSAEWRGSVETGSGTITVGDGVLEGAYLYESRFGEAAGTNPEQLLAAAHSGEAAKRECPVSQALAGIPEITLTTTLVARRSQRLRLVLEALRSHGRPATPTTASGDRHEPDLGAIQSARF